MIAASQSALELGADDGLTVVVLEDDETHAADVEHLGQSDARRVVFLTPWDARLWKSSEVSDRRTRAMVALRSRASAPQS